MIAAHIPSVFELIQVGHIVDQLTIDSGVAEEGCRLALRGCSEPLRTTMGVLRLDGLFSPGGGRAAG